MTSPYSSLKKMRRAPLSGASPSPPPVAPKAHEDDWDRRELRTPTSRPSSARAAAPAADHAAPRSSSRAMSYGALWQNPAVESQGVREDASASKATQPRAPVDAGGRALPTGAYRPESEADIFRREAGSWDKSYVSDLRRKSDSRNSIQGVPRVSDGDLVASMAARLSQLEVDLRMSKKEIVEKNAKIRELEDANRKLEARIQEREARPSDGDGFKVTFLERKVRALQAQVAEMEEFLEDYGMMWVGREGAGDTDGVDLADLADPVARISSHIEGISAHHSQQTAAAHAQNTSPKHRSVASSVGMHDGAVPLPPAVDFDRIIANIQDLNAMAGDGVARITSAPDGSKRLRLPDAVTLTLFRNGVVVGDGPFRDYAEPTTSQFVRDLVDGYFPHEFQEKYPDGVPLKVVDKRTEEHVPKSPTRPFVGTGFVLGGTVRPSNLVASGVRAPPRREAHTGGNRSRPTSANRELRREGTVGPRVDATQGMQLVNPHARPAASTDEFLARLPKAVVKDGKVIDVRSSIADMLQPPAHRSDVIVAESAPLSPGAKATTVQVKLDGGGQTIVVKLRFADTIADLRHCIDRHRKGTSPYIIRTAFPSRVYDDESATLEECGLVPNATVHLAAVGRR